MARRDNGQTLDESPAVVEWANQRLTFSTVPFGPASYREVMQEIRKSGKTAPTLAQSIAMLYSAWNNRDKKYSRDLLTLDKTPSLWTDTVLFYSPQEIYAIDHLPINDDTLSPDDSSIYSFLSGQNARSLQRSNSLTEKDILTLAAGKEGAALVDKLTEKYPSGNLLVFQLSKNSSGERPISLSSVGNTARPNSLLTIDGASWAGSKRYCYPVVAQDKH